MTGPGRPGPNAEPGTGTQVHVVASPPCGCEHYDEDCDDPNHKHPNSFRFDGTKWLVGHDYLDTEQADLVELTAVVRTSSWCDTRPAEEGPITFRFEGERVGSYTVSPASVQQRDGPDMDERFIERYTKPAPVGAPAPPW